MGCGQSGAACTNFGDCCALTCTMGACGVVPKAPTSSMGSGSCEQNCEELNMTSFQQFSLDELAACACQPGGPCTSVCTAECMNPGALSANACGMCLANQEALAESSACTVSASTVCSGVSSCAPFVTCVEMCMPSGGLPSIPAILLPLPTTGGDAGTGDDAGGDDAGGAQTTQTAQTTMTPGQTTMTPGQTTMTPGQTTMSPGQTTMMQGPVQSSGGIQTLVRHRRSAWPHIYQWLKHL
jgi:hypothetical protein